MKKINFGILGTALIAEKSIVKAMKKSTKAHLSAIASRELKKAKKFANKFKLEKHYGSYEELLKDPNIEAVYIPLPNHLHFTWAKKAIEAGKHVLIEKPITTSYNELVELYKIAERRKKVVMEAFMFYYNERLIKLREILKAGAIGAIKLIYSDFSINLKNKGNIRYFNKPGAGAISDLGTYNVGISNFLMNDHPKDITCRLKYKHGSKYADVSYSGIMEYKNDVTAIFSGAYDREFNMKFTILGTEGRAEVRNFLCHDMPSDIILKFNNKISRIIKVKIRNHYTKEIDDFCSAARENKKMLITKEMTLKHRSLLDRLIKGSR